MDSGTTGTIRYYPDLTYSLLCVNFNLHLLNRKNLERHLQKGLLEVAGRTQLGVSSRLKNNSVKKYEKIGHFSKSDFIENILNTIIHKKKGKTVKIKLEERFKIELKKVQIDKL